MNSPRVPLTRDRVLRAAITLADHNGLGSLSMRALGRQLGVEAMSLYNHVVNKNDLLDGIVEEVVSEFAPPPLESDWQVGLRQTARSVREVLLRHTWAAALVESRLTPSRVRFRYSEAVVASLRRAGFSVELAFRAQLAISSYVYGFTLQEVNWPFESKGLRDVVVDLQPRVASDDYPHLTEMMNWIAHGRTRDNRGKVTGTFDLEFEFGLDALFDGLERLRCK